MKLIGTPEEDSNTDDTETLSALETFRKMNNVKKSVSFGNSQVQEHEPKPFVDVESSLHQFHRISAVTEVTEPEESVEDVFSINPTMEAMQSPTPMIETIDEDVEMDEPADISMSNILGADFTMSDALEKPETIVEAALDVETVEVFTTVESTNTIEASEAEPVEETQQAQEIELIGAIEPLGDAEPFDDVQQIEEFVPIEPVEITGRIEPLGDAKPFEDVEPTEMAEPVETVDLIDMESVDAGFEMEMTFDASEAENLPVEIGYKELPAEGETLEPVIAELELELLTEALTSEIVEVEAMNEPTVIAEPIETEIGLALVTEESVIEGMSNDVVVEVLQDVPAPVEPTGVDTEVVEAEAAEAVVDALEPSVLAPVPERLTLLNGMTFLVDVWAADGTNANQFFAPLLHDLGATVVNEWNAEVSHVLFKDGTADTLQRAAASEGKVRCLNVGWAVE
jgi:hypothetical protein